MESFDENKNKGNDAFRAGQYQQAVEYFTAAINENPNDHIVYSNRSAAHAALLDYRKALEDGEECLRLNAGFVKGYSRTGLALHRLGRFDKAVEAYEKGLLLDPRNAALRQGLQECYSSGAWMPEASQNNEEKQEDSTEEPTSEQQAEKLKLEANELYKARKFDESLVLYDKALELNPNEISYMTNKAAVYLEKGDFDACIRECEAALERRYQVKADFTKVAKIYCRMGACYERQKDYTKACDMYEKACMEDNNRQTRSLLKDAQLKKKDAEKEAYVDPQLAEAHRQKGNEFFKAGDLPEAKHEYDEAIRRNPKDPLPYSNRAAVLTKLVEYPLALKDCDIALELDPKFVKCWSRKGTIHYFMKEYHKSLQAYQKGLDIDPDNKECRDGLERTMAKVEESQQEGKTDEEQLRHAMADPEIQEILKDPQFRMIIENINSNPKELSNAMGDPKIRNGIRKLMAAGILKVA